MRKQPKIFLSLIFLATVLAKTVSAAYYGGFGYYTISNFISTSNPLELLAFGSIFLILFAIIRLGLSRSIFKDPTTGGASSTGNIISAALAFLIMYYGLYKSNFNLTLTPFFHSSGIPTEILYPIFAIVILAGILYFGKKLGIGGILILGGLVLSALTYFTDWIYEKQVAFEISVGLLILGLGLTAFTRKTIGSGGRWIGKNHGFDKKRSKYEVFIFGLALFAFGYFLENNIALIAGGSLAVIGLFWWLFRSGEVPSWEKWVETNHGFDKKRSKYEVFIFGLALLAFGYFFANNIFLIAGGAVTIIGLVWWLFRKH